ncbi:DHA2 family lincomycin resistance protein-like MFS transporter [Nocardioides cavernae]|uniref:DHA2 family lincomycin resistance protein-like MFS transporter n=1 Tax=Nocardioides cavernae TaxID=1921566 RepID=A0A7Y9KSQ1_9ACTN|nr:DHA2 family efflux MFS transporter permease subunit [Nocardioides cavernae]NYE36747.1 DHA2 family lincomycin resistance protein-like MFS transporter [Nocardioides cavernae]
MTTTAPPLTSDLDGSRTGGHGRLVALLVASAFVVILNETIMSVALPDLMREFAVEATTAQWLTTAFLLTMAVVIPVTGWLLTRFPLRAVFVAAMASFSLGTLVAATAPVFPLLVTGRVVQAVGTALMMPLLITTILNVVDEDRRGQMMGTISIVISVAPAIGPTVSGLVLDQLSWRWMFWIVLPIALLSLALGSAWVRNVTEPRDVPVDVVSVVLSALAFGGLIYGLSSIGESASGHTPVPVWVPLVLGALALVAFVTRQLRLGDRALLDLRAFRVRTFTVAVLLVGVSMMALFGTLILLPLYLQNVLGLSVLNTGLLLLPGGLTMGLLAPVVGRVFDRVGPRPLVAPGAAIVSAALWGMTTYDVGTGQATVVGLHVLMSVGLALMFTPLMTSALGSLPPLLYSHGSAIVSTLQQVAGAAGTALFVTVMTRVSVARSEDGVALVDATAAGIHAALMYGGAISAVAVLVALLVRRPVAAPAPTT